MERADHPPSGGWAPAAAVFATAALLLVWFHGNYLVFSLDEGILLDAGQRALGGARPYVDFFTYMGPGSIWLQELALRLFGITLRSGRLVVIFDCALQCALLWWLTARLASRAAAWAAVVLYFLLQMSQPALLTPQHRWDSAALSLASVALCLEGYWRRRRAWWFAGGALAVAAASCTAPVAWIGAVTGTWILARPELRRFFRDYAAGGAGAGAVLLAGLLGTGTLRGYLAQSAWAGAHYTGVNSMSYGAINGGYRAVLAGPHDLLGVRLAVVLCLALPAVLPILGVAGCTAEILARPKRETAPGQPPLAYLAACLAAYVATTYPRPDVSHLAFVAPLGYVLAARTLTKVLPPAAGVAAFALVFMCALAPASFTAAGVVTAQRVESPAGTLRVPGPSAEGVRRLLAMVRPGDGLYVHPYCPLLYFLTQAHNPTRYSYLNPGMMTARDEQATLADLARDPPDWVLYFDLSRAEFLRVFPGGKGLDHRFHALEDWLARNYAPVEPPVSAAGYQLWTRRSAGSRSAD